MAQAVIESVHAAGSPGSDDEISVAVDAGSGQRLLVFIDTRSTTLVVNSITLDALSFSQVSGSPYLPGRSQHRLHVYEASGSWSAGTLTAVLNGFTGGIALVVARISGADPSTPWSSWTYENTNGVSGAATGGTDNAAPTGSVTSSDTDQLHLVVAATRNRALTTNPGDSDYTRGAATFSGAGTGGSDVNLTLEYRDAPPGADTWLASTGVVMDWLVLTALINPTASGGGGSVARRRRTLTGVGR